MVGHHRWPDRLKLPRQAPRHHPARDSRDRRAGKHQQPPQGLAVDDQVHPDPQHHPAKQAAGDAGKDPQPNNIVTTYHAAVVGPPGARHNPAHCISPIRQSGRKRRACGSPPLQCLCPMAWPAAASTQTQLVTRGRSRPPSGVGTPPGSNQGGVFPLLVSCEKARRRHHRLHSLGAEFW